MGAASGVSESVTKVQDVRPEDWELGFHQNPEVLKLIVDQMAEGIFSVDARGKIVDWSAGAERITGYARDEVIGKPCEILEGPTCKGFGKLKEIFSAPTAPPPEMRNRECKVLSKDGRELYILGSCRFLTGSKGNLIGAIGTIVDVTEFLSANEKISALEEEARGGFAFDGLVGSSKPILAAYRRLRTAAENDVTVVLTGESGTGKEVAARAIHNMGRRKAGPFIAINCSAIPESILESELFGHLKGAFTGALEDKTGLIEAANGGTLFLDEIGDVSPMIQTKLLRVLEDREIRRVGERAGRKVDIRLVTATHQDLKKLVEAGSIRQDFYYRIRVFEIAMPPLRDRREDIPLLTDHFVRVFARFYAKAVPGIAKDAMQALMAYGWPGNVRELKHAIEQAFVSVSGGTITLLDLPPEVREALKAESPKAKAERKRIEAALKKSQGRRTEAARSLGMSRVTLWKKMERLKIPDGSKK